MNLSNADFIRGLRQAIVAQLDVPNPYTLVVETDPGKTWAFLRDERTGANRFSVDLGMVPDGDIANAAKRAADGLRGQLREVSD